MRGPTTLLIVAALSIAHNAYAQTDVKGSQDHPLIPRYAGSSIIGYQAREYDELTVALGRSVPVDDPKVFAFRFSKSQRVEGKLTRLLYVAQQGRSSLEVFRNYEAALTEAGFQPLFACAVRECDSEGNTLRFVRAGRSQPFDNGSPSSRAPFTGHRELRYLAPKMSAPGKEVYASLLVAIGNTSVYRDTFNHPVVRLEVIETKAMETNMVFVDAAAMAKDIVSTGRAVLYGIHFDTAKDVIEPESEPTLAEIGKLLTEDRALKLYVVGHTDNVGGFDSNMDLSTRRANAVIAHLRTRYGVDASRLRPVGVGLVAPVASNASDDGRARNRRVELVKQ